MIYYKMLMCTRCHVTKTDDEFTTQLNGQKQKQCTKCVMKKREYAKKYMLAKKPTKEELSMEFLLLKNKIKRMTERKEPKEIIQPFREKAFKTFLEYQIIDADLDKIKKLTKGLMPDLF